MSQPSADRNLLFGILALQMDFVSRDALIAAMGAWAVDKSKTLGQILEDQGALSPSRRSMLEPLIDEHVRVHDGDPARSLAALSSVGSAREALAQVADPDIQASLAHVGSPEAQTYATRALTDDSPSAAIRYRRLRPHARGGLGEVFVAHDNELHREVALKEIQDKHADDTSSRTRFLVEAEITGGLEYPGIVPVYGLGLYPDGRPFYAMRFIKGDSLAEAIRSFHADASLKGDLGERTLALQKLLRRFLDVCNAIAYAHSRGVLHRDLKPGNIMVGKYGETLVVDWGLAKLVGEGERSVDGESPLMSRSGSGMMATVAGTSVGTPAYMPPEQAEGRLADHGPRSDVYSLGATLYHLLTDHAPFEGTGDIVETLRRVQRGDFPRPRSVVPDVPKALEAICLKAMALRPEARYAGPLALAADVEDWLADKAVSALPETAPARLARWARRNRAWVRAGAAALVLVSVAAISAALLIDGARRNESIQKDTAIAATKAEADQRRQAEGRLAQIAKINTILGSIFENLDPTAAEKEGKPLTYILGGLLDRATAGIEEEAIGDPLAVARMQATLGRSQLGLGYPEKAIVLLTKARATFTSRLGPDHPSTLTSMSNLAMGYRDAGKLDLALPLLEETLTLMKAGLGPEHPQTLNSMGNLATVYQAAGKLDRALPLYEQTLALMKARLGPDHPDTLASMNNLAEGYYAAGKIDRALPLFEETLALKKAKLGPDHPQTLNSMNNLALGYYAADRRDRALPLMEETLALRRAKLGPDHPDTLASMSNLAAGYRAADKLDLALPLFEETLASMKAKLGPDHPNTLNSMNNLATGYQAAGKLDRALPLYEQTLASMKAKFGPDHPDTLMSMGNLATGYQVIGKLDRAIPLLRETADIWKRNARADSPQYAGAMASLGSALLDGKRWTEAEPVLRECLTIREAKEPDAWTSFNTKSMLGGALLAQRKDADAGPLLRAGYEGMKARADKIPAPSRFRLGEALDRLITLAEATGKPDEAKTWRNEKARLPDPARKPETKAP